MSKSKVQTKEQVAERIVALRKEINKHRYNIHVLDKSTLSEAALDSLKKELFDLEQQYPDLITPDSPTQRIAGRPLDKFQKVQHATRMLSLFDAFSLEDLVNWEKRNKKLVPEKEFEYYCELKIDGLAMALTYTDGVLTRGATRGDGRVGEDVTQNIKTIESIPLRLNKTRTIPNVLEVRGEVYLSRKEFNRVNSERKKENLPLYANPRNTAAGSIRQLDPTIAAKRNLKFFAYDVVGDFGQTTQADIQKILKELGFAIQHHAKKVETIQEAWKYVDRFGKKKEQFEYQIDGMVIKVNNIALRNRMGIVGKAPRGMIAFKFPAEQTTTIVQDIVVQVGRTGALTPVAVLAPANVAGSIVARATLHNEEEIRRKDIRVGDTVVIQKAGDVIPEVVESLKTLRPKHTTIFFMPKKCPVCGEKVLKEKEKVAYRCENPECTAKHRERLLHAVKRGALNLEGFGPAIIDQLLAENIVTSVADFYALKEDDLIGLERLGEKSAKNLIRTVRNHRSVPLDQFLFALGIRHIGNQTATEIASQFPTIQKVMNATKEQIAAIHGIGEIAARAMVEYMANEKNQVMIKRAQEHGLVIQPFHELRMGALTGQQVLVTGTLKNSTRAALQEEIRANGGKVQSAISGATTILVCGENPGSKLEKAKKQNVTILTEEEFRKKFLK